MEKGITKEQAKMLQGFAILMMLYHHLFSTPEALGVSYNSLLKLGSINVELHMAWFFKICVALYAFVSGYGLYRGLNSLHQNKVFREHSFFYALGQKYWFMIKKIWGFFLQYWLVFILFVPVRFLVFHKEFEWEEFLLNLIGVSSSYNGAWWYVLFYVKMLLLLPLIDNILVFFRKKSARITQFLFYLCALVALIVSSNLVDGLWCRIMIFFMAPFMSCFLMGYIFSRFSIFEFLFKIFPKKVMYFLGIIGFLLAIAVRVKLAKDASSVGLDHVLVPVLAYGFVVLMILLPKLGKFFGFFGKYSTFMWLTHVFFYDHYTKNLVMFSRFSTGIYLTLVCISLLAAVILQRIFVTVKNRLHSQGCQ